MIETWRYHPGLTTDFMLNLEVKLSHHYVDLAKIFKDHPFLEQEFWLTAFYLNPTSELYEIIKRLGMRNNRKRTDEQTKLVMSIDNVDAKYGLLSSTIDVKELATMSNTDDPVTDYDPLFAALHSLRVPDSLIKDMLTAIFLPRNRSFAWAVDWVVLRNRCKIIMTSSKEKKRFVDLNMAEANERLKYLIIDYDKYKNRPQLDYGTIEQGYESLMAGGDFDKDSSEEEEEEEEEDFEDDEDVYENKKKGRSRVSAATRKKEEEEKAEDENSQEDDPFLMGKRRTRARTAATLASFLFQTLPRSSRRKKKSEEEAKTEDEKISGETDDRSSDSKSPITTSETLNIPPFAGSCDQPENSDLNVPTKNLKECLKERPTFLNTTKGFQNLIDIWNVETSDLQAIDENCVSLMESSAALQIAVKLKLLNKEINPINCDEKEYIDEAEMLIHNAEYAIKRECDEDANSLNENTIPMDVNNYKANVERNEGGHAENSGDKLERNKTELFEENTIERVESDSNEGPYVGSSIGQNTQARFKLPEQKAEKNKNENVHPTSDIGKTTEGCFKLPDKTTFEQGEDGRIENSTESSFKLPDETTVEKESWRANSTYYLQDLIPAEENSNESLNSDLSTAARKDSSEVSETNTEANSKRNSFNIDGDMIERIIENEEFGTAAKLKDIVEESGQANVQGVKGEEHGKISDAKREENRAKNCTELQKERQVEEFKAGSKLDLKSEHENGNQAVKEKGFYAVNETGEPNKLRDDNTDEEKKTAAENKALQENKTELESKMEKNHKEKETKSDRESNTKTEQEASKFAESKTSGENKVQKEGQPGKANEVDSNLNKNAEIRNECQTNSGENIDASKVKQVTTIDGEKTIAEDLDKTNYSDKIVNKFPTNRLLEISKHIEEPRKPDAEINEIDKRSTNTNANKFDIESGNFSKGETNKSAAEKDEESRKNKINMESTADLVEKSIIIQEQNFNKNSLNHLEKLESNINRQHSASQEINQTKETGDETQAKQNEEKSLISHGKKTVESFAIITKHETVDEANDHIKGNENEKSSETHCSQVKTEDGSFYQQTISKRNQNTLATDTGAFSEIRNELLEDNSIDSMKSTENLESTDSETRELKDLCLKRNSKVLLCKLRPCDLTSLRQPKVKVQRTSYEKYLQEFRPKRRRLEEKVYWEFDESSNSINSFGTNSSSSEAYRPPKIKRKIPAKKHSLRQVRTSDSDNDSNNSEDIKLSAIMTKKRKKSSSSRSSVDKHVAGPKSARKRLPKLKRQKTGPMSSKQNLVVTPRSASGLKLRISNTERNRQSSGSACKPPEDIIPDEIIQLSSSSSDECIWSELADIQEEIIEIDENPLFEEEIII